MLRPYTPADWYWQVAGDTRFFSSKSLAYVTSLPTDYEATRIASEQDLWDVLAGAGVALPAGASESDASKGRRVNGVDRVIFEAFFNHENRIRALAGQASVTRLQFMAGLRALL